MLRDFLAFLTGTDFPLGTKARVYSTCLHDVMLNVNETCPVKEEDAIRVERIDARMVRWMLYEP